MRYFSYIWKEFLAKTEKDLVIAGVFRGVQGMKFPLDSARIAGNALHFEWAVTNSAQKTYFFLKNSTTQEILKIASNGTQLTLYTEQPFFTDGTRYEWTVTDQEFPNLKNLNFYGFERIQREDYTALKPNIKR